MRAPALLFTLLLLACGGAKSTPAAPEPAAAAPAESFPEVHPDDVAALQETSDAGPPAPTPEPASSASGAPSEPADDCTPIGVELEKTVRPKLKECYREGKKKNPNLEGTVRIGIDVDTLGKIKSTKILEKTLPDPVAQCMLKAVKAEKFDAAKSPGKSITIPITFPTPH